MIDKSDDVGLLLGVSWIVYTDHLGDRLVKAGFPDVKSPDGVMFRLLHHRGGLTINQIAEFFQVTKQAASQTVDSLEQRGYAVREVSERDGRERIVRLTPRGERARAHAVTVAREVERDLREAVGNRAYESLVKTLRELVRQHEDGASPLVAAARELLSEPD
jgi:DNA-binding MarR family transcriptional regulator